MNDRAGRVQPWSARWRTTDPLVLVVGAVALITYALHGFHGTLTRDLGLYSYAGQQVADGVPPYEEVLNRAGPLAHVFPAVGVLIARSAGLDDIVTMRVFFLVIATLCACAVYVLGRDVFSSRAAGLVTAATFLTFEGFIQYASNGPREKTPMTLFIVLALWAMTRRRWFTAGLCVSLATLCLQTAFFSTFTAVVVGVLLLARGERLRALVRVALGGVVPVVVLATWFALAGSLKDSIEAFYLINARYTRPNPLLESFGPDWLDARTAYGFSLWLILGGLLALLLRSLAVFSAQARRKDPSLVLLASFAAGAVLGLVWVLRDYDAWPDLFPVLPLAAIGVGGLFALLVRRVPARRTLALAAALSVLATAMAVHHSVTTRVDTLDVQRASVAAVLEQLPAGARITSIEAPQPLVLTGRTNHTRYQMFRGGLENYLDDTWPGGRAAFMRDVVKDAPDLISVGETVTDPWRQAIAPQYVYVGSSTDWGWYARASLGRATLAHLRHAAGYDPKDPLAQPPSPAG